MTLRDHWPVALVLGVGLLVRLLLAPSYGLYAMDGDLHDYKQAVHRGITHGLASMYDLNERNDPALTGGDWNGGFFINQPPVTLYVYSVFARVYRWWSPAGFALWDSELNYHDLAGTDLQDRLAASRGYTATLKLPSILAETALGAGLYVFILGRLGRRAALLAAGAHALNPALVFNTAYWGQHDALWSGLLVLTLLLLSRGRLELASCAFTLALLSKPQPLAFAPLVLLLSLERFSWREMVRAGLASLATASLVLLPFLLRGSVLETLDMLRRAVFGGEPHWSCQATNLWWLLSGARGLLLFDNEPLLWGATPRMLGIGAFVACYAWAWRRYRLSQSRDEALLFLLAAVIGMAFFTLNTELHENHMIVVLPLLAFALPVGRFLWLAYGLASLTVLANEALFDESIMGPLPEPERAGISPYDAVTLVWSVVAVALLWVLARALWRASAPVENGGAA